MNKENRRSASSFRKSKTALQVRPGPESERFRTQTGSGLRPGPESERFRSQNGSGVRPGPAEEMNPDQTVRPGSAPVCPLRLNSSLHQRSDGRVSSNAPTASPSSADPPPDQRRPDDETQSTFKQAGSDVTGENKQLSDLNLFIKTTREQQSEPGPGPGLL